MAPGTRGTDDRDVVRQALLRAGEGADSDVGHLVERASGLVDEARRRRRSNTAEGAVAALVPLAWKALPRFAAATLLLVALSTGIALLAPGDAETVPVSTSALDSLILSGTAEGDEVDPLLLAILTGGDTDG